MHRARTQRLQWSAAALLCRRCRRRCVGRCLQASVLQGSCVTPRYTLQNVSLCTLFRGTCTAMQHMDGTFSSRAQAAADSDRWHDDRRNRVLTNLHAAPAAQPMSPAPAPSHIQLCSLSAPPHEQWSSIWAAPAGTGCGRRSAGTCRVLRTACGSRAGTTTTASCTDPPRDSANQGKVMCGLRCSHAQLLQLPQRQHPPLRSALALLIAALL